MKKTFSISAMVIAALVGANIGAISESRVGILDRIFPSSGETLAVEFGSLFEFASTQRFAGAPERLLADLVIDTMPLAVEASHRLSESPLDANDVRQSVSDMLLGIAGMPANRKDAFTLNMVAGPIVSGANYGKFAALRGGSTEPEDVNRTVTAHAAAALDGLLRFLSDLPGPEEEGVSDESDAKRQLDEWADELDPV